MIDTIASVASRMQPREALRALRKLLADPDDTEQAFRVIRSLDAGVLLVTRNRMKSDPRGQKLLRERPSLLAALRDREALSRMPEGSLGRAYLDFCTREGITPGGLIDASNHVPIRFNDDELVYIADRLRDTHDLYHLVTGYRTDLGGELSVLAFTLAQYGGPGLFLLVAGAYLQTYRIDPEFGPLGRRLARSAFLRGLTAEWLALTPWEEWLSRPMEDVRIDLGIRSIPVYRPGYKVDVYRRELEGPSQTPSH